MYTHRLTLHPFFTQPLTHYPSPFRPVSRAVEEASPPSRRGGSSVCGAECCSSWLMRTTPSTVTHAPSHHLISPPTRNHTPPLTPANTLLPIPYPSTPPALSTLSNPVDPLSLSGLLRSPEASAAGSHRRHQRSRSLRRPHSRRCMEQHTP